MKRFSKNELQKISELVDKGASLNVISSQMNRGKSSVQYQVAKLKGKKARAKEFRFSNFSEKELGWLIGCYAGDGSRNLVFHICLRKADYKRVCKGQVFSSIKHIGL